MENNIQIRKAQLKDSEAIAKLHRRIISKINVAFYPPEAIKEWLSDISAENTKQQFKNSIWIVAEISNKIVGFGQYSIADGEIYQINVSPDNLKQGIGKRIYDYMENDFRKNGVKEISLNSTLNAVGFYQELGFKIVKELDFKLKKEFLKMIKMKKSL